jgi:phosphoribulokinase
MKLRVKKDFKGLVEGDILEYNVQSGNYEIYKLDEVISENSRSSTRVLVSVNEWVIRQMTDYFEYIDSDGEHIDKVEINFQDVPKEIRDLEEITPPRSYINDLEESLQKLRKENEELRHALLIK